MVPWIECSNPNGSQDWSSEAQVEVRVFNHMNNSFIKKSVKMKFTDNVQSYSTNWIDVGNPGNGYLKVHKNSWSYSQVFCPPLLPKDIFIDMYLHIKYTEGILYFLGWPIDHGG